LGKACDEKCQEMEVTKNNHHFFLIFYLNSPYTLQYLEKITWAAKLIFFSFSLQDTNLLSIFEAEGSDKVMEQEVQSLEPRACEEKDQNPDVSKN
jgi:hypothetical protein